MCIIPYFCNSVPLLIHCSTTDRSQVCNFIKKRLAQVFSCEFCINSKNTFSYRTPPVAASLTAQLLYSSQFLKFFLGIECLFISLASFNNLILDITSAKQFFFTSLQTESYSMNSTIDLIISTPFGDLAKLVAVITDSITFFPKSPISTELPSSSLPQIYSQMH